MKIYQALELNMELTQISPLENYCSSAILMKFVGQQLITLTNLHIMLRSLSETSNNVISCHPV